MQSNTVGTRHTVAATFTDKDDAERALNQLREAGFNPDDVSIVARDNRESVDMADRTEMGKGAGAGVAVGAVGGGLLGWLVGVGALAIPGIGPIIAAGAIGTALAGTVAGAAVGAAAGGLVGALVGAGIPDADARRYEEFVKEGSTLLTVYANDVEGARRAKEIFRNADGDNVQAYDPSAVR